RIVSLANVVQAAFDDIVLTARQKELQLELASSADPKVLGDPARLRQVIDHLLSNAIKFTRERGAIRVELGMRENDAEITVRDTGTGLSSEDLARLFEGF